MPLDLICGVSIARRRPIKLTLDAALARFDTLPSPENAPSWRMRHAQNLSRME
jgi:hypothetical protein